ncbi:hypothetical protein BXZ70DRAFT_568744 [Cristinia sonorae]|uniref:Uncharacterized protein n=1 Tax=Cristinia sonorae TaxID=1940300 RepID=A0A8K0XKT5_9AGAR|nr:hypothetical protein BXZ70DRAFT_568744 [Cristinia sonorae]
MPIINAPAPNTPYYTPAQYPAAGTPAAHQVLQEDGEEKPVPKLFQSLKIRGVEFHNRIWVSRPSQSCTVNFLFDGLCPEIWSFSCRRALPPLGLFHDVCGVASSGDLRCAF